MANILYTVGSLPGSGRLSGSDINEELGRNLSSNLLGTDSKAMALAGNIVENSRITSISTSWSTSRNTSYTTAWTYKDQGDNMSTSRGTSRTTTFATGQPTSMMTSWKVANIAIGFKMSDFHGKTAVAKVPDGVLGGALNSLYGVLDTMYGTHYVYFKATSAVVNGDRVLQIVPTSANVSFYSYSNNILPLRAPNPDTLLEYEYYDIRFNYRRGCSNGNDQQRYTDFRISAINASPFYVLQKLGETIVGQWGC